MSVEIVLQDDGITVRFTRLRRLRVLWPEVERIEERARSLSFLLRGGVRRRLSLWRFRNDAEIQAAVAAAAARANVAYIHRRGAR